MAHLPPDHARFVARALPILEAERRLEGIAAAGSWITDDLDAYSDLDFVLACSREDHAALLAGLPALAGKLGRLLSAFTGEHVGEPRLLICLYEDPLLHVDLKLVATDDLARRIEDPVVLFDRRGTVAAALASAPPRPIAPDRQWLEDRFWVWVHYAATKLGRGELLEVLSFLDSMRTLVLAPLVLEARGALVRGVRRFERFATDETPALVATIASHDREECTAAIRACVAHYRRIRAAGPPVVLRGETERAAVAFFERVAARAEGSPRTWGAGSS